MLSEIFAFDSLNRSLSKVVNVKKGLSENLSSSRLDNLCRAGGCSFRFKNVDERILIWQTKYDKLFLRELSFIKDIPNDGLEFNFSYAQVLCCNIFHENTGIYMLVSTTDGVFQCRFALPTRSFELILTEKQMSASTFHPIKGLTKNDISCTASARYGENHAIFAFGLKHNSVILVTLPDRCEDYIGVHELQIASKYSKIWSGIIPKFSGNASDSLESPVSLAFICDKVVNPLLVCVCKDHRFRAWDLQHRQCISTVDLLKSLCKYSHVFDAFTDSNQRVLAFSPGDNHCVKSANEYVLIYFELMPTNKVHLPTTQLSYWIWIRVDVDQNVLSFPVVHIEPIKCMPSLQRNFSGTACHLIDFAPCLISNLPTLETSRLNSFVDASSGATLQPTLGIWSLFDGTVEEGSNQPMLEWTCCKSNGSQSALASTNGSLFGISGSQLWQEPLPESIFVNDNNQSIDEDRHEMSDDATEKNIDLPLFVEFIFTPGRFARHAIYSAFKSLTLSHHLHQDCFSPDEPVHAVKTEVSRVFTSVLQPSLSALEFTTLLRMFHQSLLDYHHQACEPLALFCVQTGMQDVIVVRRSAISLPRQLPSKEEVLCQPLPFFDACAQEPDYLMTPATNQMRSRNHLLSHCRSIAQDLEQNQVWLECERNLCKNIANFSETRLTLNQIVRTLLAQNHQLISRHFLESNLEGIDEAFAWFVGLLLEDDESLNLISRDGEEKSGESFLSGLGTSTPGHLSTSACLLSTLTAELLRQGVGQTVRVRLRLCVGAYLLWCVVKSVKSSVNSHHMELQLQQIFRSLAIIQWLTLTRCDPIREDNLLTAVRTHLKLLGMQDLTPDPDFGLSGEFGTRGFLFSSPLLLQDSGVTLLEEILLSASSPLQLKGKSFSLSHLTSTANLISAIQRLLTPVLDCGRTMLPVLKHLLQTARCNELLTLCKCLAPMIISNIHLQNPKTYPEDVDCGPSELDPPKTERWWPGDANVLYVCVCLTLLWSGFIDEAVEKYIESSLSLRNQLLSRLHPLANECLTISSENTDSPCYLLEQVFREFSLVGSLGLPPSIYDSRGVESTAFFVDEVQIRYLIKVMPVLEQLDKPQHVIRLCEYALGVIERASRRANKKGLLNFRPNNRLAALLCNNTLHSGADYLHDGELAVSTSLFPVSAASTDDDTFLHIAKTLSELEAVLRTRIFRHELAGGNASRAHALVVSNPDKARQRDCLHLLITTLCDNGKTTELVGFEYGLLENELISTLESRARASDVLPKVASRGCTHQPVSDNVFYDVLYAYYIRRLKFHSAAQVYFEQALRLAEESVITMSAFSLRGKTGHGSSGSRALAVLQKQALCLSACISALRLLPAEDQWLMQPESETAITTKESSCIGRENTTWAFDDKEDEESFQNSATEGQGDCEQLESIYGGDSIKVKRLAKGRLILSLADLEHQYLVVLARLRLAEVSWEQSMIRLGFTSLEDLHSVLIATALYEEAFQILVSFNLDPSLLVSAVASRCVTLTEHSQTHKEGFSGAPCLPHLANVHSPLSLERSLVAKSVAAFYDYIGEATMKEKRSDLLELYWSLLKVLLTVMDSYAFGGSLRAKWDLDLLACRIILVGSPVQHSSIQLPVWLTQRLLSRGTPGPVVPLLRLLYEHNRLQDACRLASAMLSAAIGPETGQCPALLKKANLHQLKATPRPLPGLVSSASVNLPHGLFTRLLDDLAGVSHTSQAYASMHAELQCLMRKYYSTLVSIKK